jgi:putative ABC transport system permease protein
VKTLRLWIRALLDSSAVEDEIDEEIELHLELRARDYRRRGFSEEEARRLARRRFGDEALVKSECRRLLMVERTKGGRFPMSTLARELRFAFRSLAKTPGSTAVILITLALGIGANTAIFSVIEGVLLRPLPYAEPDRLLSLWENDRLRGTTQEGFSLPDYVDVRDANGVFESMAALTHVATTWTPRDDDPQRLRAVRISASLPETLGVPPVIGRSFRAEEDQAGAAPVVILSFDVFRTRFGERPDILGEGMVLDGVSREIVGVMPERFDFPSANIAVYLPLEAPSDASRGQHGLSVVARMKKGTDLQAVNAELRGLASRLEAEYADDNAGRGMWGETLYQSLVGETRKALMLLFGAVGFVLLVSCVNVAGILSARALARSHERAIQSALGADRFTLFRQQLVESLALALSGGMLALLVAAVLRRALLALAPSDLPRAANVATNGTVLAFALGLSLAAALLFGILPAIAGTKLDLRARIGEGVREAGAGRGTRRLRRVLLVAEIALAVVLVFGAGLLIRSFVGLLRVDPGFGARNVIAVALDLPASRYPQRFPEWPRWNEVRAFQVELLARLSETPGIDSAAIALNTPLDPGWTSRFMIEGRPAVAPGELDEVRIRTVSPGYFRTLGIPVLRGRDFTEDDDRAEAPARILVNDAFARRYFRDEEVLGARVFSWDVTREIVGVVKDEKFLGLAEESQPAIYPLFSQTPFSGFFVLVRAREAGPALDRVRQVVKELDPELALGDVATLDERIAESVAEPRFTMILFSFFAALALGLAGIGIYGLMSQAVGQRTRELGVRMSLGARPGDVLGLVLGEGARLSALGIALGVALALMLARAFESFLFGVGRLDPLTLGSVVLVAAAAGLLATYLPARRASRIDPIRTLRQE